MFCLFFFLHLHRCFICWSLNVITYISQHVNPCQKMQSHNSCKLGKNSWPLPEDSFLLSSRMKNSQKLSATLFCYFCSALFKTRYLSVLHSMFASNIAKIYSGPWEIETYFGLYEERFATFVSNHNKMCQTDSCVWCFLYVNWYSNWSIQWLPTNLFVQKGFSLSLSLSMKTL